MTVSVYRHRECLRKQARSLCKWVILTFEYALFRVVKKNPTGGGIFFRVQEMKSTTGK